MLIIPPPKQYPRKKTTPKPAKAAPPVSAAPVLVSAAFSLDDGPVLTLGFDRAVQITGFDPAAIGVVDGPGESLFDGSGGAVLSNPTTVVVSLTYLDAATGSDVTLTASGATGIASADGSVAWAGVSDLVLPFP